jgi:hypothetical protein
MLVALTVMTYKCHIWHLMALTGSDYMWWWIPDLGTSANCDGISKVGTLMFNVLIYWPYARLIKWVPFFWQITKDVDTDPRAAYFRQAKMASTLWWQCSNFCFMGIESFPTAWACTVLRIRKGSVLVAWIQIQSVSAMQVIEVGSLQ